MEEDDKINFNGSVFMNLEGCMTHMLFAAEHSENSCQLQ